MIVGALASRADARALAVLFARTMGTGWFPAASVEKYAAASGPRLGLVARDEEEEHENGPPLVGGLLGEIVAPGALSDGFVTGYDAVKDDPMVARLRAAGPAGLISAVAVDEAARGRGAATHLLETGVAELAGRGAAGFFAFAWTTREKGCHLGGALARTGFVPVRLFEDAYKEFSARHDCRCPFCAPPCRCSAWLYIRV